MDQLTTVIPVTTVIPAKAGIHTACFHTVDVQANDLDSRFRGNDGRLQSRLY